MNDVIEAVMVTLKETCKDLFHWLELITEILSFLQIFSLRMTNHWTSEIFQKVYFWHVLGNTASHLVLFLPDSSHCFFYRFSTIHSYLFLLFSHFVYLFTCIFLLLSRRDTFYNLQCLIWFHYNLTIILRR